MKTIRNLQLVGILPILISGCGREKSTRNIEVDCEQFNQDPFITDSLTIDSGEQITIKLCSNPSTGFQWSETAENTQPEILYQDSHDYSTQEENGTPFPPGTPGMEIWRFNPKTTGQSLLSFAYSRNWEGGEKGTWTYTLDVTVQ